MAELCPTPTPTPTPTPPPEDECPGGYMVGGMCQYSQNPGCTPGSWGFAHPEYECAGLYANCECSVNGGLQGDPVLIDTAGDGFRLTSPSHGVSFDIDADGDADRIAWTAAGDDDGWLALDRDGDGRITSGGELFGNITPQPDPPPGQVRQGFLALAEYDRPVNGGNGDGVIDARDAVFSSLRLWRDANHDAVSEADELYTLPELNIARLHLDYKESKRVDEHGNQFRYRAKVGDPKKSKVGRWAWDVFLKAAP